MNYKKKAIALGLAASLLAACGNQNEQLEKFYKQVEAANKKEETIVKTSADLEKLENQKIEMFNKINKGDIKVIHDNAKKLLVNVDERRKVIEEEKKTLKESEKTFEDAKALAKDITDKVRKKEAQDIVDKVEAKYRDHDELMKAYESILKKETSIFKYLQNDRPEGKVVNDRIKDLNKDYEAFQKKMTKYVSETKNLEKEKRDVVNILNNK